MALEDGLFGLSSLGALHQHSSLFPSREICAQGSSALTVVPSEASEGQLVQTERGSWYQKWEQGVSLLHCFLHFAELIHLY